MNMFKKQADLPPEPKLIINKQICEDLSVPDQDSLFSDSVKEIIAVHDIPESNSKVESFNPKSFQIIDKILNVKEDMAAQRKFLIEQVNDLYSFTSDLKQVQELIKKDVDDS